MVLNFIGKGIMFQKSESIFVFARVGVCHKARNQNVCSASFSMDWRNQSSNSRNQFYCYVIQLILLFLNIFNCIWDWHEANYAC